MGLYGLLQGYLYLFTFAYLRYGNWAEESVQLLAGARDFLFSVASRPAPGPT
jgi:hypothetical protein